MSNLQRIRDALAKLLTRQDDEAFVIIEHRPTGKFVQFAGSASEMLLLDLPSQTLSELEFYRAVEFFRKIGIAGEEFNVLDEPYGQVVGRQFTFNVEYRSPGEAAQAVLALFRDVYQLPDDCELQITED